ncbi:hypothetical protein, partial [Saccharothrix sp. ST-888]|uniref:hypothetical protein n=1 Tax=Saccharothrix sp. ST-888 TaxID=1427391 RepID=UPI0005ECCE6F
MQFRETQFRETQFRETQFRETQFWETQRIVLREGDQVTLLPALTAPVATLVPPPPLPLPGSAGFRIEGHLACVPGDIEALAIVSVAYQTPTFGIAGSGRVQLRVPRGNRARYARTRQGTEVVVDGGPLDLVFTPVLPAS